MTIALIIAAAIAALLVYAATQPDSFRLERSTAIQATPEKVFPLINDFRRWTAWSPWENKDPDMKRSHSGTAEGRGAVYAWQGNKNVGEGSMEITESVPASKVVIKLDFMKPFEAHNHAEFTLAQQGGVTTVTWAMYGPSPYFAKLMGVFCSMDRMVGKDFVTGLANLKSAAEAK